MSISMTGDRIDTVKGHVMPVLLAVALAMAGGALGTMVVRLFM